MYMIVIDMIVIDMIVIDSVGTSSNTCRYKIHCLVVHVCVYSYVRCTCGEIHPISREKLAY